MTIRTGLRVVIVASAIMMVLAVILSFWCESASYFSFRVEDLTKHPVARFPIGQFKSTLPGFLDFLAIFILAVLILRRTELTILGVPVSHATLALAILGLTAWNVLFAAFLVTLEFKYLQPCPV
jgi:hypothetical protein